MCEPPRVYSEQTVQARKQHKCCECRKPIVPGADYVRASGIWDKPATYKTCIRCDHLKTLAVKKYPPEFSEEGPAFGQLRQWIKDYQGWRHWRHRVA